MLKCCRIMPKDKPLIQTHVAVTFFTEDQYLKFMAPTLYHLHVDTSFCKEIYYKKFVRKSFSLNSASLNFPNKRGAKKELKLHKPEAL